MAKVVYCLLLSLIMVNTALAVEGLNTFFTPEPVSFPAKRTGQALKPYHGQPLDFSKKGIYYLTAKYSYHKTDGIDTPTLFLAPCSYSIIITLNDMELYRWGDFKNPVSMTNFSANAIVLSNVRNGENHLKLYFYSDGKRMPLPRFYIGDYAEVAEASATQTLFNLFLIQAIGIVALFSALLFFGYSAASKFKEHDILYFSFFAFTIFMGYSHFIMNSPTSDDLLWFKISRIGYALAAFLLFSFSCEYTSIGKKRPRIKWVTRGSFITLILALFLFSGSENQKLLNDRFSLFSMIHILPLLFAGYLTLLLDMAKTRKAEIILIIGGYSLFLMGTIHDIAFVVMEKEPYFWMTPYGYFIIIITIIYSLILRYYNNIRKREETESLLRESEEKYRLLMESSPDSIVVYDMEGKVVYLNPAFTRVFGWSYEELQGEMIDYVPDKKRPETQRMIKRMISGEKYQGFETQRFTKDGDLIDISMSFDVWRDQNGNRTGSIVTLQDVTEQKKTQELIVQTEKMMSIGGLAAGMAHEINNPLAGVMQNANLLEKRLTDMTMPANINAAESVGTTMDTIYKFMQKRKIPGMTQAITTSGKRMASIVENMLSFARKSDSAFSAYDPAKLVDKVLELAATDFNFKSISIKKEYGSQLPQINCERSKIQQVLLNILKNGAHEMVKNSDQPHPTFTIRLEHETDSHMLRIEIEDNGPGMDKPTCKKIFEPFFTTKPEGVGTGLGLSVSYFIVTENHKGEMTVVSEPEKGSNFIIHLPIEATPKKQE